MRVETEIYDLYGSVEEDPVWKKFEKFHQCELRVRTRRRKEKKKRDIEADSRRLV